MITVKEVQTRSDLKKFANFPLSLYKGNPYYVPSLFSDEVNVLNPKKNFSLQVSKAKCFLAYKDGKLVGRVAGVINTKYNEKTNHGYIRFSRFDAIDDIEVFQALLNAVAEYGKSEGMQTMHGPWGFNDTDREGMLTYGFDRRSTYATNYSYEYYHKNLEKLGFQDESKWIEYDFVMPTKPYEKVDRIAEKLKSKYKLIDVVDKMPFNKVIKNYAGKFFETMNEAYGHLDGYIPIVGDAQKNVLKQFATIINPKFASILVDEEGDVAALGIVIPSIANALIKCRGKLFPFGFVGVLKSMMRPKELEMALIGVKGKYKNTGINAIMISKIVKNMIDYKIEAIESNPMLTTNLSIQRQWNFSENEIVKRRQTYQKEI